MAKRVTNEDIIHINEVYSACGTYAETARKTGFSPSTVKKYIVEDFKPVIPSDYQKIEVPPLESYCDELLARDNLSMLSFAETQELSDLWKEMLI